MASLPSWKCEKASTYCPFPRHRHRSPGTAHAQVGKDSAIDLTSCPWRASAGARVTIHGNETDLEVMSLPQPGPRTMDCWVTLPGTGPTVVQGLHHGAVTETDGHSRLFAPRESAASYTVAPRKGNSRFLCPQSGNTTSKSESRSASPAITPATYISKTCVCKRPRSNCPDLPGLCHPRRVRKSLRPQVTFFGHVQTQGWLSGTISTGSARDSLRTLRTSRLTFPVMPKAFGPVNGSHRDNTSGEFAH